MKLLNSTFILISALLPTAAVALPPAFYAPKSVLSEGKWVKVGVDETGLYEVSYAQLRQMGFSNPEKVGVYGRGGGIMANDFTDFRGQPAIDNDLSAISVWHLNDKLYFYGVGVDSYSYTDNDNYSTLGYYNHNSKNIYSNLGYYFLSETDTPLEMKRSDISATGLSEIDEGLGLVFHEVDLKQNNTRSGQLFWGEDFIVNGRCTWDYCLPDLIPGREVVLNFYAYLGKDAAGEIEYGLVDAEDNQYVRFQPNNNTNWRPLSPTTVSVTPAASTGKVFVDFNPTATDEVANLDYWSITFPKHVPALTLPDGKRIAQDQILFNLIPEGEQRSVILPGGYGNLALDVTDPVHPVILPVSQEGTSGRTAIGNSGKYPKLLVFSPARTQKKIKGWTEGYSSVANQNLHRYSQSGTDLLIITVEQFLPYAERIAEIHREHDGFDVLVATVDQIYNEFSAGVPDPMAYRSLARMLYDAPAKQLKNILLIGQTRADFRGLKVEKNPLEILIAYQNPIVSQTKGAHNTTDFYGMMDDTLNSSLLEKSNVQVGVGILPFVSETDAENYIEKIERWIKDDSYAYRLNEVLDIGGLYDRHTHDGQALQLSTSIEVMSKQTAIVSNLMIDAYGERESKKKFLDYINNGKFFVTYVGHGGPASLGKNRNFFSSHDAARLKNNDLFFMTFAGCELSNTDFGKRGIGETMVTAMPNGLIGSIAATRATWSGQNILFLRDLYNNFYRNGSTTASPRYTEPQTIGKMYAAAKTTSTSNNEMAYQLYCDPALVFPSILQDISVTSIDGDAPTPDKAMTFSAGKSLKVEGNVLMKDGAAIDNSFNGELVFKLIEPPVTLESKDLLTAGENDTVRINVRYADRLIYMGATKVADGKFKFEIPASAQVQKFDGQSGYLYMTAYNPATRTGAAVRNNVDYKAVASSEIKVDTRAPKIETMEYNDSEKVLVITVSDDTALNLSDTDLNGGFNLYIDGKSAGSLSCSSMRFEHDAQRFTKKIPVHDLVTGNHSARLEVRDAAGNSVIKEITFTISDDSGRYRIILDRDAVLEESEFECAGDYPSEGSIVIIDKNGATVREIPLKAGRAAWDRRDAKGKRVAAGLYKAYLLENGNSSSRGHSPAIHVPVI